MEARRHIHVRYSAESSFKIYPTLSIPRKQELAYAFVNTLINKCAVACDLRTDCFGPMLTHDLAAVYYKGAETSQTEGIVCGCHRCGLHLPSIFGPANSASYAVSLIRSWCCRLSIGGQGPRGKFPANAADKTTTP